MDIFCGSAPIPVHFTGIQLKKPISLSGLFGYFDCGKPLQNQHFVDYPDPFGRDFRAF